jgi:hypothetical protein
MHLCCFSLEKLTVAGITEDSHLAALQVTWFAFTVLVSNISLRVK